MGRPIPNHLLNKRITDMCGIIQVPNFSYSRQESPLPVSLHPVVEFYKEIGYFNQITQKPQKVMRKNGILSLTIKTLYLKIVPTLQIILYYLYPHMSIAEQKTWKADFQLQVVTPGRVVTVYTCVWSSCPQPWSSQTSQSQVSTLAQPQTTCTIIDSRGFFPPTDSLKP